MIYPIYIPEKKRADLILIPKILNFVLMISFLPVFAYGIYLLCQKGALWGNDEEHFLINVLLGYGLGLGGGMVCHEAAHVVACLSDPKGRWYEAGIMRRGIIVGLYVWLDTSKVKSRLKRVQIYMAGMEMNLVLASLMMILLVNTKEYSFLFPWKRVMFIAMMQNIFLVLFNISFAEGLDGEHTISELFGDSIVDAAKANIQQLFLPKDRREYFKATGAINGGAVMCMSSVILMSQLMIPMVILGDITMFLGDVSTWIGGAF